MRGERWHGRRERMLLPWVLSSLALLSAIHGSRGSATSPVTSHVIFPSGSFPVISPAPHEANNTSDTTHAPLPLQPASSPMISPMVHEVKNPSNTTLAPLTPLPHTFPVMSPAPHEVEGPSSSATHAPWASQPVPSPTINLVPPKAMNPSNPIQAPSNPIQAPFTSQPIPSPTINLLPPKAMNPSNAIQAPLASQPVPSPTINLVPPKVMNPSNAIQAPLASQPVLSPTINLVPPKAMNHSTATEAPSTSHPAPPPAISPSTPDVNNPSNATQAPSTSHPAPSPVISPVPHDVKNHSNATQAPSNSHPAPSPKISPMPHDVKNHSNATHAPSTLHPAPSPKISPAPHDVKNHSNATQAPSTSHPAPSPVMSPMPHDVKNPSNATQAPSTSHPTPFPEVSPAPHDVKNPSNATQAPSASHPAPSPAISPAPHDVKNPPNATQAPSTLHHAPSPVISSAPHDVKNHSNTTQAPSTSHPAPSPEISPAPHGVKNHSIATQAPSTSHPAPSPEISPTPHGVKNHSNATQAPSTSHPAPSPMRSPAPHDVKNPSNATQAPSTLHPAPSPHDVKNPSNTTQAPSSSHPAPPMISPTPYDVKNPSNSTLAPLTSHPTPSPMMIPTPHEAKNPSKTPHSPLSSHHGSSPAISPSLHKAKNPPYTTHAPLNLHPQPPDGRILHSPALSPAIPISVPPLSSHHQVEGPMISPAPLQPPVLPKNRQTHHAPPFYVQGPSLSPIQAPFYSTDKGGAPTSTSSTGPIPSPSGSFSSKPRTPLPQPVRAFPPPPPNLGPIHSPTLSPSASLSRKPRAPSPPHVLVLPPPPPNSDCNSLTCSAPLTNTPPGAPCACVLPIKVGLRLGVALYTFFPLVSELAQEIAAGIFVKQSQVRIMGANAASNEPEKTVVLINLVPLGRYFDNTTAFFIYERFWHKQVAIQASYFGDYDVLYVLYQGLPSSPPTAPADINVDDGAYGNTNNARTIHPLGVDVTKRKEKLSGSLIAIIVLSSVIAMVFIVGAIWFLLLKHRSRAHLPPPTSQTLLPTFAKSLATGARPTILGSGPSSTSASFSSSIATYAGSGKTFSLTEMERATNRFDDSRIIGEGGFGRVYQGTLEDGTQVAVKVLKRDDQQGGREFLAEVEMLSRLHHRNLVKLIGICTEDVRCLVYELIPNGSVESHLHGVNKETAPLDWNARVKIALGAARGLAYLHEDSSPCVIHRDFKSSNILLEHDFTPKVSDFGLARTAVDEGNEHISTRVMGTFGYVAPEYAMTGHLLVKSDVYSYGVVLLELLTGRKPVDMSQPPGQENLVTWARPLLTSLDGLEMIIDPALGVDVQFDNVAKVAAIASMCVQPEVTHRPFMGEVVQALRLVCNESDEHNRASVSCSQEELSGPDTDIRISMGLGLEAERALSASDIFSTSARFTMEASRSSRRHSSSGPLTTAGSRQFWRRVRGLSGSMSEHGFASRFVAGLDARERWP